MQKLILKFLKSPPRECRKQNLKLDHGLYQGIILYLQDQKDEKHYFELEDRLITEIVFIVNHLPPKEARQELQYIKDVIFSRITTSPHVKTYLKSIRNSIRGALSTAYNFIPEKV